MIFKYTKANDRVIEIILSTLVLWIFVEVINHVLHVKKIIINKLSSFCSLYFFFSLDRQITELMFFAILTQKTSLRYFSYCTIYKKLHITIIYLY